MIKKFALATIAVTLLALGTAFMLPREWRVERHVVINATPQRVHALLFDLKRWQDWSVWTRTLDPQLRNAYEGPQDGLLFQEQVSLSFEGEKKLKFRSASLLGGKDQGVLEGTMTK